MVYNYLSMNKVIQGDCLEQLKNLPDNSVDAVVTDPPYGLSFMGKKWDYDVPSVEIWQECLRVLKPGGYLLAFAGTRTQHRMAVRIEDAGFEIRDMIAWVYGSGFPKSLNIGKAVDKLQGNEREQFERTDGAGNKQDYLESDRTKSEAGVFGGDKQVFMDSKGTSEWEGWGTALKPALEPITVARKPLSEKTVALNVLKWGTGGINIDGSRVGSNPGWSYPNGAGGNTFHGQTRRTEPESSTLGRFPANLIHDGSDEVVELFPNDSQRFFYCAKASKSERNRGCEGLEEKVRIRQGLAGEHKDTVSSNSHPTVKPIALMEYLVKLVTKENALVLDPFAGSGTTGVACKNLNRNYILIERESEYIEIISKRLEI